VGYGVTPSVFSSRGNRHEARPALAYLARRHTEASLAELAPRLGVLASRRGVSRPESVPNLTRRFTELLRSEVRVRRDLARLEESLSEFRKD